MDSNLRRFFMVVRQALLMIVGGIEHICQVPRERRKVLTEKQDFFDDIDRNAE